MSARGLRLRSGVVHSLMAAAVRQGWLHSALPLLGELEHGQHELQPSLAQELLRAALSADNDEGRAIVNGLVQLYSSRREPVPEEVVDPLVEWIDRCGEDPVFSCNYLIHPFTYRELRGVRVHSVSISAR